MLLAITVIVISVFLFITWLWGHEKISDEVFIKILKNALKICQLAIAVLCVIYIFALILQK